MNFDLSLEQLELREAAAELTRSFPISYWREKDQKREFPMEFWEKFREAGYLGIPIPEEYGGAGLGLLELVLVLESVTAAGSGATGTVPCLLTPVFGSIPIVRHGTEQQKREMLPALARGDLRFAMSLTEPDAGTDTLNISTSANRKGEQYSITGRKVFTSGLQHADKILIIARTMPPDKAAKRTQGLTLFIANADSAGVSFQRISTVGLHTEDTNSVVFENLVLPVDAILGQEDQGWYHLLDVLNPERIAVAAMCLGVAQLALNTAVSYAKERVVYGRPIGQNQGIQFPLAEAFSKLELARLMTYKAAWLFDQGRPCGTESNLAKLSASNLACELTDQAMQTCGGFGYTVDYDVERYWRDIRLYRIAPLPNEMILNYIGTHVLGLPRSY